VRVRAAFFAAADRADGPREVDAEYISKPFDIRRLEEKVRQLLDASS
jgi:hypothetical protein